MDREATTLNAWTPRSRRLGISNDDGPFDGVPDHLKPQLLRWIYHTLSGAKHSGRFSHLIALRLRITLNMDSDPAWQLMEHAESDDDVCWDVVEGAVHIYPHHSSELREVCSHLRGLLTTSGSVYRLSDDLEIVERVGAEAQAVYDAATATPDHVADDLREAWSKAYGRSPDPSDAWDHAIKAIESVLAPVVEPNNAKPTLGSMIAVLGGGGGAKFKSAFAGPGKDNSVDALADPLKLVWPNTDRHGEATPPRTPTLQEARAVVNLGAALVQCDRDDYLIALR